MDCLGSRGYVATRPTFRSALILSPARKRWGPPRRQGLCSHLAHLWATSESTPWSEAVWTPTGGRGYVASRPLPPAGVHTASDHGVDSEVAQKWAGWLHNPCRLGGPHHFRAGGGIIGGPHVGQVAT